MAPLLHDVPAATAPMLTHPPLAHSDHVLPSAPHWTAPAVHEPPDVGGGGAGELDGVAGVSTPVWAPGSRWWEAWRARPHLGKAIETDRFSMQFEAGMGGLLTSSDGEGVGVAVGSSSPGHGYGDVFSTQRNDLEAKNGSSRPLTARASESAPPHQGKAMEMEFSTRRKLSEVRFVTHVLGWCWLSWCWLSGLWLSGCRLSGCRLSRSWLSGCRLSRSWLSGCRVGGSAATTAEADLHKGTRS
ncbi:hypothetical protein BKA62DRAFT_213303 [Auriculariales sp. MPI-PUGE-AT-0066]|nr:hypothetical protein BKA62DRAFT_213303 [Auriculariales sp. MPI-PUGE-AT-0066]